jgi:hypothetical protein
LDVLFLEPALPSRTSITEPSSRHGISRVDEAERSWPWTTGINQRARTAVGYTVEGLLLYSLAEYSRNISLVHILKGLHRQPTSCTYTLVHIPLQQCVMNILSIYTSLTHVLSGHFGQNKILALIHLECTWPSLVFHHQVLQVSHNLCAV